MIRKFDVPRIVFPSEQQAKINAYLLKVNNNKVDTTKEWREATNIKNTIKEALLKNQKDPDYIQEKIFFCSFCRRKMRNGQIEHFADKSTYKKWMFYPRNLSLSCYDCNSIYKKKTNTIKKIDNDYEKCEFYYVHPYDDPNDYFEYNKKCVIHPKKNLTEEEKSKAKKTIKLFHLDDVFLADQNSCICKAVRCDYMENKMKSHGYNSFDEVLEMANKARKAGL